jgi:hypothetical protein
VPSSLTITPWNPPSSLTSYTVETVNLDSYSCQAVMAEDGVTPKAVRYHIAGSGLISAADWQALRETAGKVSTRCAEVRMEHGSPLKAVVLFQRATSVTGGPVFQFTATEVVGGNGLAMVKFDLTDEVQFSGLPVLAHTWAQTVRLDAAGVATRTVSGHVRVWRGKTGGVRDASGFPSGSGWTGAVPWADVLRKAVIPIGVRQGWRRESQEFGLDPQGIELVYSFVDRQYAQELPDGVRVGDFDFTYERSLDNPAVALVSFTCELEGGHDLKMLPGANSGFTGNRALVAQAVALSRTRLNADLKNVLITKLKVTERDVLSKFAIRLEIDAQILPDASTEAVATANPAPVLRPLAAMVGQAFVVRRTTSKVIPPYGLPYQQLDLSGTVPTQTDSDVYAMVAHYLQVGTAGSAMVPYAGSVSDVDLDAMQAAGAAGGKPLPVAQLVHVSEDATFGTLTSVGTPSNGTNVYLFVATNQGTDVSGMNQYFSGGPWQAEARNTSGGTIISYAHGSTQCAVHTGMTVASRMHPDMPDAVFQVQHPRATLKERIEVVQMNEAPRRFRRPLPAAGVLISEEWNASFGKLDAQGNRNYVAVYERTYQVADPGTQAGAISAGARNNGGFKTVDQAGTTSVSGTPVMPAFGNTRTWAPRADASDSNESRWGLMPPLLPTLSNSSQSNTRSAIDAPVTNPEQVYPVNSPQNGYIGT